MPGRYAGLPAASIRDDGDEARHRVRHYNGHAMPGAEKRIAVGGSYEAEIGPLQGSDISVRSGAVATASSGRRLSSTRGR